MRKPPSCAEIDRLKKALRVARDRARKAEMAEWLLDGVLEKLTKSHKAEVGALRRDLAEARDHKPEGVAHG